MIQTKHIGLVIFLFFCILAQGFGQIEDPKLKEEAAKRGIDEQEVKRQLDLRNLTEEELKRELQSRGLIAVDTVIDARTGRGRVKTEQEKADEKALEDERAKQAANKKTDEKDKPKPVGPSDAQMPVDSMQIYGQQLFGKEQYRIIEPNENFKAPDNYVIGSGDEVTVSAWGDVEFNGTYKVTKDGYIKPYNIPRIYLKGLSFAQAKESIKNTFGKVMDLRSGRNQMEVVLTYFRPINVGIYGEVKDPGSYSFSALNSAFNALSAAGGPVGNGSVRRIKILRSNKTEQTLDVYKYLNNPSINDLVYLDDNDIIFVPVADKVVRINGAILRPYRYELIQGEGLLSLIRHAGGLLPDAYKNNIRVERFLNDKRVLQDVNLTQLLQRNEDFELQNGDRITISKIDETFRNFVSVQGAVELVGDYQLQKGMRVLDLVNKAGLKEDARLDQVYILRKRDDLNNEYLEVDLASILENPGSDQNIELKALDVLRVSSLSTFVTDYTVSVEGEIREPGTFEYDQNLKVSDLIYFGGGAKREAADIAILQRINADLTKEYKRVNIARIHEDESYLDNVSLQPLDTLFVYAKSKFADELKVEVYGAVRAPGEVSYFNGMTVTDLLFLAGGLKKEAANKRIEVSRLLSTSEEKSEVVIATLEINDSLELVNEESFELLPNDQVFVRTIPEFEVQRNVELRGEVVYPGVYPIILKNEKIYSVIRRAGGPSDSAFPEGATLLREEDSVGLVLLDLEKVLKNPESKFNYVLKDGDIIIIPKIKDLVTIKGKIKHPAIEDRPSINVPYHNGRRAKFYVNHYGTGIDKKGRGRKNLVYVEDPNGFVKKTKSFGLFHVYPKVEEGSIVSVEGKPKKPPKEKGEGEKTDWGKVFLDSVTAATAVLTLILLIDRVK